MRRIVSPFLEKLVRIPQERCTRDYLLIQQVMCLWALGELDRARELGQSVLLRNAERGDAMRIAVTVEYLSWVACGKQEHELAALLLGGAGVLWRKVGTLLWSEPGAMRLHNEIEATLMLGLGAERFTEVYGHGAGLPVEELVALAGADTGRRRVPAPRGKDGSPLGPLTPREREVAHLIAEGLSNRQIAERLVISKRTADAHIEHILTKLGFNSRNQVAAMIGQLGKGRHEGTGGEPEG